MSNRKKIKKRPQAPEPAPRPRVTATEENKEEVARFLGYTVESVDEALQKAKAEGYSGVSFPIPPRS